MHSFAERRVAADVAPERPDLVQKRPVAEAARQMPPRPLLLTLRPIRLFDGVRREEVHNVGLILDGVRREEVHNVGLILWCNQFIPTA